MSEKRIADRIDKLLAKSNVLGSLVKPLESIKLPSIEKNTIYQPNTFLNKKETEIDENQSNKEKITFNTGKINENLPQKKLVSQNVIKDGKAFYENINNDFEEYSKEIYKECNQPPNIQIKSLPPCPNFCSHGNTVSLECVTAVSSGVEILKI